MTICTVEPLYYVKAADRLIKVKGNKKSPRR